MQVSRQEDMIFHYLVLISNSLTNVTTITSRGCRAPDCKFNLSARRTLKFEVSSPLGTRLWEVSGSSASSSHNHINSGSTPTEHRYTDDFALAIVLMPVVNYRCSEMLFWLSTGWWSSARELYQLINLRSIGTWPKIWGIFYRFYLNHVIILLVTVILKEY